MKKPNRCRRNSERCRPISSRIWGGVGKVRVANSTALILPTVARSHKSSKFRSPKRSRVRGKTQTRRGRPVWGRRREAGAGARTVRAAHGSRAAPRPSIVPHRDPALPGGTCAMHPRAPGQQGLSGSAPGMSQSTAPQLRSRARPHGPRTTTPITPRAGAARYPAPQRRAACRDL